MIRIVIAILCLTSIADASDPLYRKVATWQYYTQNGCQYRRQVYSYEPYQAASSYSATITKQDLSGGGWREKLLDIAKQRDAWEGSIRAASLEQTEFVESVKLLGLQNNFTWNGYGYQFQGGQQGAYSSQQYSQLPAEQGSTIYGYRESADVYGNIDLGAFMNDLLRLRQQSYDNESIATSEVHSIASEMNDGQARVAEIRAKSAAAAEVLKAASPQERVSILKEFWQKGTLPNKATANATASADIHADADSIIESRCMRCHNDQKKEGKLSLVGYNTFGPEQRKLMLERVTALDARVRMPPEVSLPIEEIAVLFHALSK